MLLLNRLCVSFIAICMIVSYEQAWADSVKLKNGSYFEGRITEDTGGTIKMTLAVGEVEFKKSDIEDMSLADQEENYEIEQRWGIGSQSEPETDDNPVDQYLNKGKVKYQGRWVSEDVYDVIQREKEIKEKRYRFLQQKKKREREEAQSRLEDDSRMGQSPVALQEGPASLTERYKHYGKSSVAGNVTKTIAVTESEDEPVEEEDTSTGLNKVKRFGEGTKTLATTKNPYELEDV